MKQMFYGLLFVVVLLVSCSVDQNTSNVGQENPTENQEENQEETQGEKQSNDEVLIASTSQDGVELEVSQEEIQSMDEILSQESQSYMIKYEAITTIGEVEQVSYTTMYVGNDGRLRVDSKADDVEIRFYVDEDSGSMCSTFDQITWNCIESPPEQELPTNLQESMRDNPSIELFEYSGTRQYLTLPTTCYELITAEGMKSEYCYTSEGIPFFIYSEDGKGYSSKSTAIEYDTRFGDDVFEMPI